VVTKFYVKPLAMLSPGDTEPRGILCHPSVTVNFQQASRAVQGLLPWVFRRVFGPAHVGAGVLIGRTS
jgi:hypothetical protein